MEIEGFDTIISSLVLAKKLYDIDRFDIVEQQFFDVLSWDAYFENMMGVISSIFMGYSSDYSDEDATELMTFEDDVISNYFVYAWKYGKLHNIHYSQNPYVEQAHKEVERLLHIGCCVGYKLLAYTRTKKSAQKSRLLVLMGNSCGGCNIYGNVSLALVQLYSWFTNKCAEFETLKIVADKHKKDISTSSKLTKPEFQEVKVA